MNSIIKTGLAVILFSMGIIGNIFAKNLQQESHNFIMQKKQEEIERTVLLQKSLQFIHAQYNTYKYSNMYTLEKENKDFINTINFQDSSENFSSTFQNIAHLKDVDIFLNRNIWNELEVYGDDETLRAEHLEIYLALGNFLYENSQALVGNFSASVSALQSEISALNTTKKEYAKNYTVAIDGWNAENIEEIETDIIAISQEITPKEIAYAKFSAYNKRMSYYNEELEKTLFAVNENKDALVKNVKVQLESGKYINAIQQ